MNDNSNEPKLWHLTLTSEGRMALFPDDKSIRKALLKLVKVASDFLVSFCLVDEHIHLVLKCPRDNVGIISRAIQLALSPIGSCHFNSGHITAVTDRTHLERLISYCVIQPVKHGLAGHPALYGGSCFLDLIGARCIGALGQPLSSLLPRFDSVKLYPDVSLPPGRLMPLSDEHIKNVGVSGVAEAVGAVLAAAPGLNGNSEESVKGRRVAVILALRAGITSGQISDEMKITKRSINRLKSLTMSERVMEAVRIRLALEKLVGAF